MTRRREGGRLLRRAVGPAFAGAGTVVLCVAAALAAGPPSPAGAAPSTGTAPAVTNRPVLAYVTDYTTGYLSVIDTTTSKVTATIPLSLKPAATCTTSATACKPTTTHPVGVTASPGGTTIYVDCSGKATVNGAIDVIDVATDTVTKVIPLAQGAVASAINPNGTTLYVAVTLTGTRKAGIDVVDLYGAADDGAADDADDDAAQDDGQRNGTAARVHR